MNRLRSRLPLVFFLLLVMLGLNVALSYYNTRTLLANNQEHSRIREIIESLDASFSTLQDAETGQRGYLLVGREEYLKPYQAAVQKIRSHLERLRGLVRDDPARLDLFTRLRLLTEAKLDELDTTVKLKQQNNDQQALSIVGTGEGQRLMEQIRTQVTSMRAAEFDHIATLDRQADSAAVVRTGSFLLASGSAIGILVLGFFMLQHDMRQREAIASESQRQKDLLAVTLTSIGDAVIATDTRQRITLLNEVAESLTGWKSADAIGRPLTEVFNIVNEQTRKRVESPAARVLKEDRIVDLANSTLLLSSDGREIPIDDSGAPIRDGNGNLLGVIIVFRDIAREKQAQAALRASESRFRTMADSAPVLIWIADTSSARVWFNKTWLDFVGKTLEQQTGDLWLAGVHPDDLQRCRETYLAGFAAQQPFTMEYRLHRHDGMYRWVLSTGVPLHDDSGGWTGFVGSALDITDRRELEQALESLLANEKAARAEAEAANRTKDEFLAVLSHELRTPLSPVLATVRMLENNKSLPRSVHDDLETIRRNAELEARLIDDLLDLTRVARNKIQLHLELVDTHSAIQHVFDICCSEIQGKRQRLVMNLNAKRHFVNADIARLQQMFWNLVKNASKFTPEHGTITISTSDAPNPARPGSGGGEGMIRIEVSDTGMGIDPAQLPKLFNAFEQGGRNTTRRFGGLGLGLAITKALAEIHGGNVMASSEGPGSGATFAIELPSVEAPAVKYDHQPAPPIDTSDQPLRILLVEDHADTRKTMARLVSMMGHTVDTAGDVESAFQAASTRRYDLILSDIGLPDGTGIDLIQRLHLTRQTPAIALTGFGMEEDIKKSLEAGFAAHLTKPVNFEKLQMLIHQYAPTNGNGHRP